MRHRKMLAVAPIAALVFAGGVAAQDATPDNAGQRVAAGECQGEARPVEEVLALVGLAGTPAAATPERTRPMLSVPLGRPVDAAARQGINATVRALVACLNANDIPRAGALMTDYGLQRFLGAPPADAAGRAAFRAVLEAVPAPRADADVARLIAVTNASILPDGRAVAFVILNEPLLPPEGPETLAMFFVEQDGAWLIDDYIDFSPSSPSAFLDEGTPAPE